MPAQKRASPAVAPARRRSGRLSSTPKKSAYFEASDSETGLGDEEGQPPLKKRGRPGKKIAAPKREEPSEDEFQDPTEEDAGDESDDDDDDFREADANGAGEEDEEEYNSEIDESAPMKTTIIPLEVMRDTGGREYADERLHKNTSLFLKDLKANNKRSWLKCKPNPTPLHL